MLSLVLETMQEAFKQRQGASGEELHSGSGRLYSEATEATSPPSDGGDRAAQVGVQCTCSRYRVHNQQKRIMYGVRGKP